eukprot:2242553-Amphidinium_carterae.1
MFSESHTEVSGTSDVGDQPFGCVHHHHKAKKNHLAKALSGFLTPAALLLCHRQGWKRDGILSDNFVPSARK